MHSEGDLERQRLDRINEHLADGLVKGAPGNLLAHGFAALDAASLAHIIGHRAQTALMIPYGHSLSTLCTYRQALQQSRTFARRAFLSFRAQSLSVVTQTLDILLELIPGYIALMRVSNQRSPLLGRDFDEGSMAVGMEACVRATKAEGADIARMMQDPKDTGMLELIPHDVAFVRSMCDAPRKLQPMLSKLFYGCDRGVGPTH